MSEIEKIKHLFVPVTDRLPESGRCIIITSLGEIKESSYTGIEFNEHDFINVTHWLDLSILTTKERAIKFAEDALYFESITEGEGNRHININQSDL